MIIEKNKLKEKRPTRVALYARRSAKSRDVDDVLQIDHDEQERVFEMFCSKNELLGQEHHRFFDTITVDTAPESRPGFQALLRAAESRAFDVVAVYNIRILARNIGHISRIIETLNTLGIELRWIKSYD